MDTEEPAESADDLNLLSDFLSGLSLRTGSCVSLQETNQKEQGAAFRHDGRGEKQRSESSEPGQEGEAGSLPTPVLPAAGETRTCSTCRSRGDEAPLSKQNVYFISKDL